MDHERIKWTEQTISRIFGMETWLEHMQNLGSSLDYTTHS